MQQFPHGVRARLAMAMAAGVLLGCSDSTPPDRSGIFYGPVTAMADGTGRAYVSLDGSGAPTDIGLALTETTLTGLTTDKAEFVFVLPSQASATAYRHAAINWEPIGHGAPGTAYTVPHFDVHFYTITEAQRAAIVLGDSTLAARMVRPPAAEFIPAGYVVGGASVQMGLHWRDPTAPEFNGQPFGKTFIYGSYDGAMIFGEPMIAKTYLETKPPAVVTPVKLPAQYSARGYQATSYTVGYDATAKEFRVSLSGLVSR